MSTLFPTSPRRSPIPPQQQQQQQQQSNRSSLLPDLQSGTSFADEIQQDIQQRFSTEPGSTQGSLLFPTQSTSRGGETTHARRESEDEGSRIGSMLFPPVPIRRRSQSSPNPGLRSSLRNSTATMLPYERGENDDEEDGQETTKEGEVQPRVPVSNRGATNGRTLNGRSSRLGTSNRISALASNGEYSSGGDSRRTTTAIDYLLMEEAKDQDERSIDETPRTRNKRLSALQGGKRTDEGYTFGSGRMSRGPSQQTDTGTLDRSFAPPLPTNYPQADISQREEEQYSKEEAWYFLRALVGQEIRHEETLLWKLKNLDATEDLYGNGQDGVYEESIPPAELPILRYLIKHFLLTLPLVRDVTSPTDYPIFWTEGLFPMIRAIHEADLSKAVDRKGASGVPSPHDSSPRNALERFVAAGLKLSSSAHIRSNVETSADEEQYGEVAPAMDRRATSTSTARFNFQPTVPPPVSSGPSTPPRQQPKPSLAHSSSSKRFSFSRLFSGSGPLSNPPSTDHSRNGSLVLGAVNPSSPRAVASPPSAVARDPESPGLSHSSSWKRLSTAISLPPPIPHVFPSGPAPTQSNIPDRTEASASVEPESPIVNTNPTLPPSRQNSVASRARRADSESIGFTSGLEDGASFVSAREAATTEGGDSDVEMIGGAEEDEDVTAKLPGPVPTSTVMAKQKSDGEKTVDGKEGDNERAASVDGYDVDPPAASTAPTTPPRDAKITPTTPSAPTNGAPSSPTTEKRSSKFGFGSLLRSKRSRSQSAGASGNGIDSSSPGTVPVSRRVPTTTTSDGDFVAHMAIPNSLLYPQNSTSESEYPMSPASTGAAHAVPIILQKGGAEWPYESSVAFAQVADFDNLKWGGFEADIVGVRKSLFSVNYIIRIRRPARLDEFVLRNETQFVKFWRTLDKSFPNAHIRRIPAGEPKNDVIIRPRPSLPALGSTASLVSGMQSNHSLAPTTVGRSRFLSGVQAAAGDRHNAEQPTPPRSISANSTSHFARSLRAQSLHSEGEVKAVRARRVRSATFTSAMSARPISAAASYRSIGATSLGSRLQLPVDIGKKMPANDQRRRALRSWLRDVLAVRTVGHNIDLAKFLLSGSEIPKDSDVLDIAKRELIDQARQSARVAAAQGAPEKVRTARNYWSVVEEEIIHGDGLAEISATLKEVPSISKLPLKYQKVLETLRYEFAETIFETLVAGESSGSTFAKLKSLHASFPYFLVRQALRIKGSSLMARALQDILISRPFGGKSLLQRILATCLDDDPVRLHAEMDRCRARIGSNVMCEKLEHFVQDSRDKKAIIRRYAEENDIELVLCIVRGADEPRLPAFLLSRVRKAQVAYRKFIKTNPSPLAKAQVQDPDVRLVLELQLYLRLASRDRDSSLTRAMLANEEFAAAIEVVAEPFVQLLKRTYRVGSASQVVSDLQTFLNQLIIIVEALRSRVQDPQKSVRVLARLLSRHEQSMYTFVRSVHRKETIVEEFLQWFWTASVFLRRGLAEPVDIDRVVPPDQHDDKAYLLDELEDLTAFHSKKRFATYQASCRRFAGDVQEDDPILVEGDGKGKSRIEPMLDSKPTFPILSEIPLYASAFRDQLKNVFAF